MNHSAKTLIRYTYPILAVMAAHLFRMTLERFFGPGLPTYVTFYPVVVLVAVFSGLGPGLVATITAAIITYCYLLTPHGTFRITSAAEAIGLAIFVSMGIFMSLVAAYYLRLRTRLNAQVPVELLVQKQVMERTADLQQALRSLEIEMNERLQAVEELRQKERMLNQQSRLAAMGEMISNIAHQWRQPLNTLGLLIQQLPIFYDSEDFSKEFLVDTTTDAMKLIQHMSSTIDDFRDFFRPEKEQSQFSVDKAIYQAISLVDVRFRNQNLSVEVRTDGNPVINGFPNEFSQVIMNIILNAKDALLEREMESGIIRIRAGKTDDRIYITISDNAGGIPEDIIDRIFEPYFTTKGPDRGTGIGLFMAKTIIEQNHGGQLSARNFQGGAEFRIEI